MLTWNIYHGRAVPPARRPLLGAFARALAAWEWDVALLQEVPPWWPEHLGRACGADARRVLTSRNALLPVRRAIAARAPDLARSNGGGADAILVRGESILAHRARPLRRWPERRRVHAVRVADGTWFANLHASVHARAALDVTRARDAALEWAGGAPLVLGGDFNTRRPPLPGFARAAQHRIDGVWAHGLEPAGPARVLDARPLSDHAPVLAVLSDRGAARSRGA